MGLMDEIMDSFKLFKKFNTRLRLFDIKNSCIKFFRRNSTRGVSLIYKTRMFVKIEKRFLTYRGSLEILRTLQIIILDVRLIFNFRSRGIGDFLSDSSSPELHCQNWVTFFFCFYRPTQKGDEVGRFFYRLRSQVTSIVENTSSIYSAFKDFHREEIQSPFIL